MIGKRHSTLRMLVMLACIPFAGHAQIAPLHHWVGFTDKADCGVDLGAPNAGPLLLSERALARRAHHGIALDSLDLPVPPGRIAALRALGQLENGQALRILHCSKWFNGVVIQVDTAVADSATAVELLAQIEGLDGVAEVRRAGWHSDAPHPPVGPEAPFTRRVSAASQSGSEAYGATWPQTEQLRLDLLHGLGHRGSGIRVGVLDSGFDRVDDNPAFDRARAEGRITIGGNFPNGGSQCLDLPRTCPRRDGAFYHGR